jgi:hypothetical protein
LGFLTLFRFGDHLLHLFVGMEVAIAAMFHVVNAAEEFRLCYRRRIRPLHRKRYLISVEGLLDEDGNCAGHGEAHAVEKALRPAFGVVVDPEVYLCHGSVSPSLRILYQISDSNVNETLYSLDGIRRHHGAEPVLAAGD